MRAFTNKKNKYGEVGDELTENMSLLGSSGFEHRRMEEEEYGTEYEGNFCLKLRVFYCEIIHFIYKINVLLNLFMSREGRTSL